MNFKYLLIALFYFLFNQVHADDLRSELQTSASAQDPKFPDGKNSQLTHFSVACELKNESDVIYVVDQRAVLTGMLAPRGLNQVSFFNKQHKYLGYLRYVASRPLWCEGQKLFLFGGWDGALLGDNRCATGSDCNVVEWDFQQQQFKLSHEKKYGSSGGIDDP